MPAATLAATKTWTRIAGSVTIPAGYVQAELWININITGTDDANRWYFTDVEWRPASITQPAMAAISTEQTARASADGALSTRIDSVNASLGTTNANVQTEISARAAGDTAQANYTTQVNSKVDSNTASISSAWSSIGGLNAQYTVKIDNNGYVSGFGLASYPVGQGIVSEFAVRADTFSIQLPGYPGIRPFTVGAVYGNPQVIINSAIIGDAAINNAKIGDAQITASKIGSAQIQTAHIGTAQIDTLRIAGNAVSTMVTGSGVTFCTVGYDASGGQVLVIANASGGCDLTIDGNTTRYIDGGTVTWSGALSGHHTFASSCNTGTVVTLTVFEAKR
jgi:hypothetical protein